MWCYAKEVHAVCGSCAQGLGEWLVAVSRVLPVCPAGHGVRLLLKHAGCDVASQSARGLGLSRLVIAEILKVLVFSELSPYKLCSGVAS